MLDGTAIIAGLALALPSVAYAGTMPAPAPSASPAAAGACAKPQLSAIAVRPGIGRAPATSGAVCVAPPGVAVLGFGARSQTTTGIGRQFLATYPAPVALVGIMNRTELIVAPGANFSRRSGLDGTAFAPSFGQQDVAIGAQYVLGDRPAVQQAAAVVITLPTGYPAGPVGFSTGFSSYSLSYALAVSLGGAFGLSTSQGVVIASGVSAAGATHRFVAYQPTFNVSYALSAPTTLLLEDQITTPSAPQGPTGNRALLALQETLSPAVVLDVEYELNLLPSPGLQQHAFGGGVTLRL